jgi:hypothetical protein
MFSWFDHVVMEVEIPSRYVWSWEKIHQIVFRFCKATAAKIDIVVIPMRKTNTIIFKDL